MNKNNLKNKNGFTIIEMLIVIFILLLIGVAIINFQINIFSYNKISGDNLLIQEDARSVLKAWSTEVRSMSSSDSGAYALQMAGTSSLIFYDNIDSDSATEQIRYFLSGTTLNRGIIKPDANHIYNSANESIQALVRNVATASSSIFEYYDANYDGTSAPLAQPVDISAVRLIKMNLIIDDDLNKNPPPLYMTTQVSIRNLKDNL